jgi:hypothetical protein
VEWTRSRSHQARSSSSRPPTHAKPLLSASSGASFSHPAPALALRFLAEPSESDVFITLSHPTRLLELEACAHATATAIAVQPPQRVYLCLVDAGHIRYCSMTPPVAFFALWLT